MRSGHDLPIAADNIDQSRSTDKERRNRVIFRSREGGALNLMGDGWYWRMNDISPFDFCFSSDSS
jgi:hypothetical protein